MTEIEAYVNMDDLGNTKLQKFKSLLKLMAGKDIEFTYNIEGACDSCDDRRSDERLMP